jgi:hypothetical protein
MKFFALKSGIFLGLSALFILLLYVFLTRVIIEREEYFLKLPAETHTLFTGDSEIEMAVNDSLISHSLNIASAGESYHLTYLKLKSLVKFNRNIKTVYLGYWPEGIRKTVEEERYYSNEYVAGRSYLNYMMDDHEKLRILEHNKIAYIKGLFFSIKNYIRCILYSYTSKGFDVHHSNFGGYKFSTRNKLKMDFQRRIQEKAQDTSFVKGELEIGYLKSISQLCKERSVRLILLSTPKHPYYSSHLDNNTRAWYYYVQKTLLGDSLSDFSDFKLPEYAYADILHLNYIGARIFSKHLAGIISSHNSAQKDPAGR